MKVNINLSPNLKKVISDRINEVIKSDVYLSEVASEIVDDVKRNAKSGYQIDENGDVSPFERLEVSTINNRNKLRNYGNATARPYSDEFSNLSMSGQLIESVKYSIKNGIINIFAFGFRRPYFTKSGVPSKSRPISNDQLSSIHHNGNSNLPSRPFIGLRRNMRNRILVKIREYLRRSFEKSFKVKNGS